MLMTAMPGWNTIFRMTKKVILVTQSDKGKAADRSGKPSKSEQT